MTMINLGKCVLTVTVKTQQLHLRSAVDNLMLFYRVKSETTSGMLKT